MKRLLSVLGVVGLFLMLFSMSMLVPILVAYIYKDGGVQAFLMGAGLTFGSGFVLWMLFRSQCYDLRTRDGFLVVALFWVILSFFGSLPIFLLHVNVSMTNAMFMAVSGLTTTGGTVFTHIERFPHALLFYRQELHFLGGMGIIILAVAILPMLGLGGMQLYRAELTGPVKTTKLTPRIAQTAKALWGIYVGLVLCCAFSYWMAGMIPFDAICEAFSTVSTGGFSNHDNSFAYYHSSAINCLAIFFMLMGGISFALHFQFLKQKELSCYFKDTELGAFILGLAVLSFVCIIVLLTYHFDMSEHVVLDSFFTLVSISTTTGLTVSDFSLWPLFLPTLLMFVAMVGACAGSTSGGVKVMRILLLKEQGLRELRRLVHPKAVVSLKLGSQVLSESIVHAVWGFFSVFIGVFILLLLVLLGGGLDFQTAFGALSACLSNTGASIGAVAHTYAKLSDFSKWVLILAMWMGRLEIFTVLVLLMPRYWLQ